MELRGENDNFGCSIVCFCGPWTALPCRPVAPMRTVRLPQAWFVRLYIAQISFFTRFSGVYILHTIEMQIMSSPADC